MAALAALAHKAWSARRLLVLLLMPLALLPLIFLLPPKEGRCLFVVLLMAVYWCTEALPLAVTALLPIILFPFLGILPSNKVCSQYFLDTNFLFLSGLIMASAIEEWNLHRRIALKVLMFVGVQPARLILGMMVTTSFLSMWLSNTASTAMMLPIASAILKSLFGQKEPPKDLSQEHEENAAAVRRNGLHMVPMEMQFLASTEGGHAEEAEAQLDLPADPVEEDEYRKNVWKGFLISIPYSASIGGTATLTGTAPNLILLGQLKSFFPQCDVVNFGSWFIFAFPLMVLFLLVGWLWITFLYVGIRLRGWRKKKSELQTHAEDKARAVIQEEFQNLGPTKFAEQAVFILFCAFAVLLFSRDPKFIPGWASFFTPGFISDAVTGVAIVIILFFFPSQRPSLKWWFDFKAPITETEPLLSWRKAQETVPWNIILLLGGGFAMAKGCEAPLPAGVGAVGVDRRAAAPAGARASHAGRPAHHCRHLLLHRVRQQHGYHHHLPAHPGRAGHPPASAPAVPDDPGHSRLLLRLHAARLHSPQLHRLRLGTPAGQRHGADRPPDESDGRSAAQPGHKHLGTEHLPAGHLPGLGPHPRG
ncbi:PREDICTED: solute carrier family 13 member 3 isoform X2 [Dipodomys ordii]|uniref:Solute carrier family 13 member 3 isoform X2 n=1 Tax=Dipodomys ordii TaxID=10020 RepID=A0A1S3ES92_DIPOR|nr:PREDICTED: solute carrier family 13 member 3 isoform X2 [Dipodomys ordii]